MRLAGTLTRKIQDVVNSTTVDAEAMTITLYLKKLVMHDVNEFNRQRRHHKPAIWNHSDQNIVYYHLKLDHAVHLHPNTFTTVVTVFAMSLDMEDAVEIKTISKQPKNAKINVEMYKIFVVYRQFVDVVKKMLHAIIMIVVLINVIHLNIVDAVEIKIISIQNEIVRHNANVNSQNNNHHKNHNNHNNQKLMM